MIAAGQSEDIVYTSLFTGVPGNYLKPSIARAGLDPDSLPAGDPAAMDFSTASQGRAKAWRDIWGCGQGIGPIKATVGAGQLVGRLDAEYRAARARLAAPDGANSPKHAHEDA
jgi:nitronate monooxygenase